jgi:hypothetical protein
VHRGSKYLVRMLGAGLPRRRVESRIGEAEDLADELARLAGRPVAERRLLTALADTLLADRLERKLWGHLPTLAGPGGALLAAGLMAAAATPSPSGGRSGTVGPDLTAGLYPLGVQGGLVALMTLSLLLSPRFPRRVLAALALALAGALLEPLRHSAGAGLALSPRGAPMLAADYLEAGAVIATALLLLLALVPLALGPPVEWPHLGDAVRTSPLTRRAWPALSAAMVVLTGTFVLNLRMLDPEVPVMLKVATVAVAVGQVLCATAIAHTARGVRWGAPAGGRG